MRAAQRHIFMASRIHTAKQYRSAIAGVTPMMFVSNHHFPRHSHDQFGAGVIASGGQRSWSSAGTVRASAGDVIMVNPGEIHDGAPLDGAAREWRIIYLEPAIVTREADEEFVGPAEIVCPVACDPVLASHLTGLFHSLIAGRSDPLERGKPSSVGDLSLPEAWHGQIPIQAKLALRRTCG